jgi:RNAse (barnase) inhibitor barstar
MDKKTYVIDGQNFSTLEGFDNEVEREMVKDLDFQWGRNLDAFNDVLRCLYNGWDVPNEGFILRWKNSSLSKERLSYKETVRQLEKRLQNCHPSNRERIKQDINLAEQNIRTDSFRLVNRNHSAT